MRPYLLLVFAVVLTMPSVSNGADAPGTLKGVVQDASGAALPGAAVFIHHWKWRDHSLSDTVSIMEPAIQVDSKGEFSIQLPPGVYEIFVAYPTFAPYSKRVKIEAGKQVSLECELPFDDLTKWIE